MKEIRLNLGTTDVPSEVEELVSGYNVEKMAIELDKSKCRNFRREHTLKETYEGIEDGFILGLKAHQELVKDRNKEVIELLKNITEWSSFKEHPIGRQAQQALDLLLPKTEWNCCFSDEKLILL